MKTALSRVVCTIGLIGASAAALAGETKAAPPQEPVGFITGAVIGGFAAGPIGAVVGAGLGTWLGNRVHRAGEAGKAEAQVAKLTSDAQKLASEKTALSAEKSALLTSQANLAAVTVRNAPDGGADVLDGLQGDVLFRTGSAEITPDIAHQIQVIAQAVTKTPSLKVRLDGYADPRGGDEINMKLSQDRAIAVRDLLVAAGVGAEALEVNAHGKTQSVATDSDGYALERRVRVTLQMESPPAVAQTGPTE